MRRRLRESHETSEAVLQPDGQVVHAEGRATSSSARDVLRAAVRHIDRVRCRNGESDPDAALEAWKGLVRGRWSLVDRFDHDGRRFLVARPNDPRLPAPTKLSMRERQVAAYVALGRSNRAIAYTLGISVSTVATHLRRAMHALGAKRRADLAALDLSASSTVSKRDS
jgi:DNA-binding NarL/FixJ family response regulator